MLPPRLLFRFAVACRYRRPVWDGTAALPDEFRLVDLAPLDGCASFADVRAAWSEEGLTVAVVVSGKGKPVQCHERRMDRSDGLQVWLDTRDTHNIHRASRFCHRFAFLPGGGGRQLATPVCDQLLINRARENAQPVRPGVLAVRADVRGDGYSLAGFIPAAALTGFDPAEQPRLGFTCAVLDHEFGEQTFGVGGELPYDEDPSLWATLDLVRGE